MPKRGRSPDHNDSDWAPEDAENAPPEESEDSQADSEYEPPTKRRRISAKSTKKTKSARSVKKKSNRKKKDTKFTKKKLADLKRPLNQHVKTFGKMVDRDWHDGYEQQGEELVEYFESLRAPFQTVYNFARVHRCDYIMCHEMLKYIGDSWSRVHCVPSRIDIDDTLGDSDADWTLQITEIDSTRSFSSSDCMNGLLSYFWVLLLLSVCADETDEETVSDGMLDQWIRDAVDFGVSFDLTAEEHDGTEEGPPQSTIVALRDGIDRLNAAIQSKRWLRCPSTKKAHRMRRCIDRRFDGPRHLRTRDYGWEDEQDDCVVQ